MARVHTLTTTEGTTLRLLETRIYKVVDKGNYRELNFATGEVREIVSITDTVESINNITEFIVFFTDAKSGEPVGIRVDLILRYFTDLASRGKTKIIYTGLPEGFVIVEETLDEVRDIINSSTVPFNGFMDYNDTTGSISLTANIWTDVPNNGLGTFTNKAYKPSYVTELMDVSTGYINPTELYLGDSILIRNDYVINPNSNRALLEFRYVLGAGAEEYTLEKIINRLDSGSGIDYRFSLNPDLIYMGDTNTQGNPIKLQIRLSESGTLTNAGSVIKVIK